ncbi:MAG TPA: hypothetical protein DEB24_07725 [Coriobacteriia bacterium]|nr:hypothetical protein [Coriobacteriia bacterium]
MKKLLSVCIAALFALSFAGVLVGCSGGSAAADDIIGIGQSEQTVNGAEQDNYTVSFKYTAEEWKALPDTKKVEIATSGYEKAVVEVEANASSSFNILGISKTAEGESGATVLFMLNHENSTIAVYNGEKDEAGKPGLVQTVEVRYPFN